MADINVYFFWPGLIISIAFSIIFSILLTIGLNLRTGRRRQSSDSDDDKNYSKTESDEIEDESGDGFEEPRTKAGGMIMIGPIPIVFGNGGFRFDKSAFKYALIFFLIVVIVWFILARIVRL